MSSSAVQGLMSTGAQSTAEPPSSSLVRVGVRDSGASFLQQQVHPRLVEQAAAGDAVRKASIYSDSSADFIFGDGTVMCFKGGMDTFTASNTEAPTDLVITALCLSKYREKVANALAVFNRFSTEPKLIQGLTRGSVHSWRQSAPIDSFVLQADASLLSVDAETGAITLLDATKRVTLKLQSRNAPRFTITWPARVLGPDNSSYVFVKPTDEYGNLVGSVASQRAIEFVNLTQEFPVDHAPDVWQPMLALAMTMISDDEQERSQIDAVRMSSFTVPTTRDAVNHSQGMSFVELMQDDVPKLVAARQLHLAGCAKRLHPTAAIVATFDDVLGCVRSISTPENGPVVAEMSVDEDNSTVRAIPNGAAYAIVHTSKDGEKQSVYHQAGDGSVSLPVSVPGAASSLTRGRYLGEAAKHAISVSQHNMHCSRGAAASTSYPLRDLSTNPVGVDTSAMVNSSMALTKGSASPTVERVPLITLTTRSEGVGTFTALSSGVVRVAFDDRSILSLTPDATDSESGLVCTFIDADATVSHQRVVQMTPNHKAYPYLMYAMPFRRFSKLTVEEQQSLHTWGPGGPEPGSALPAEPSIETSPSSVGAGSRPGTSGLNSSGVRHTADTSVAGDGKRAYPSDGGYFGHDDVLGLIQRTKKLLAESSETSSRNRDLLHHS